MTLPSTNLLSYYPISLLPFTAKLKSTYVLKASPSLNSLQRAFIPIPLQQLGRDTVKSTIFPSAHMAQIIMFLKHFLGFKEDKTSWFSTSLAIPGSLAAVPSSDDLSG